MLRGLERFRILEEDSGRTYRRGGVEPLPEAALGTEDRLALKHQRTKLEALLARTGGRVGTEVVGTSAMNDADLVNALSQYLDLEPLEKQALLERGCLRSRADSLVELLEMKIIMARTPGRSNVAH
jgi:Lon protease-like protein